MFYLYFLQKVMENTDGFLPIPNIFNFDIVSLRTNSMFEASFCSFFYLFLHAI